MKYRKLGRTGLDVSLVGIGSGGPSKLGQNSGVEEEGVRRMVTRALDLGINFIDSAAAYGESETILGRVLEDVPRGDYILATKFHAAQKGTFKSPEEIGASVERSLVRLKTDCIDVLQVHGIEPADYGRTLSLVHPILDKLKQEGKCRFTGVSETYGRDARHEMLPKALADGYFDTAMVGYNLLSPTAEREVLPACQEANVGVICMVAVRKALSRPDLLVRNIAAAKERGLIDPDALPEGEGPLDWLLSDDVGSIPAAAYKYVAAHPAISTVLTGTANVDHLEANVKAILGPSLPDDAMVRLRSIFGDVWEPLGDDISK
jgi:aryl-alcohol dehydrogenase-like predicted oxidoreductase